MVSGLSWPPDPQLRQHTQARREHGDLADSKTPPSTQGRITLFHQLKFFNLVFGGVEMERWDPKIVHIYVKRLDSDYTLLIHTALQ